MHRSRIGQITNLVNREGGRFFAMDRRQSSATCVAWIIPSAGNMR
ncbi:hypothetical protein SS05631_c00790 [Sinorhizobium sp. CCBAU 05631]|nr:hypothetical protein SS05631_c00790 [Sinorhizobium sp. CCBAU 05631]